MTVSETGRLNGIASIVAFLTILPAPDRHPVDLRGAAKNMHLFPVVGMVIGLGVGMLAWGLFELPVDPLLSGLLVAAVLLIITGFHHTDGLADLADGLMVRGTRSRRLEAMRDKYTGVAGVTAIVLCISGLVIAISLLKGTDILIGILLAEMLAKFSMVVMAFVGRPVAGTTSGSLFVDAMKDRRKFIASAAIVAPVAIILGGVVVGTVMIAVSLLGPIILAWIAARSFGGVSGDVFGAANDIIRVALLMVFVSI